MRKVGGLIISRKSGEEITLLFNEKKINRKLKVDRINPEGWAIVSIDGKPYQMSPSDYISVDDGAIYLEEIIGGRVSLRLILNDSVRILRSELLN
jgi:hypothetical protein